MKRREFIKSGIVSIGAIIIGSSILSFKTISRRMIAEDTLELKIKEEFIDQFLKEADQECFWDEFSLSRKFFVSIQYALSPFHIKLPYYGKYLESRNQITGQFLLSTDLFFTTSRTEKVTKYLGFHNPYKIACSNPFSSDHLLE